MKEENTYIYRNKPDKTMGINYKRNTTAYLLVLLMLCFAMNAQNRISGTFNPVSRTFETNTTTYWVGFFEKDVARIYKDGYVGLIDSTGTILCEPKYDDISLVDKTAYKVSLNNKQGLIDNKGNEIRAPFTSKLSDFKSGFATYVGPDKYGHNRYGIVKKDGTSLTKPDYVLLLPREGSGYLYTKNDQVGLIDYNGKETVVYNNKNSKEAIADNVIRLNDGVISKLENCAPKGYFNSQLLKFDGGFAVTFKKFGACYKYGFMNKSFKTVIAPKYDWVEKFVNGIAIVSVKEKWGAIDTKGNQIIPCKYTVLKQVSKNRFVVSLNNKFGVIDNKNKIIISIKYKPVFGIGNNLYATHDGKKWGLINEKERLILPYEYDGISLGMATKYESEISLPTGLPRQTLYGKAYHFDKQGNIDKESTPFSKYVEGGHNFLSDPSFFSPLSFSKLQNDSIKKVAIDNNEKYDFSENLINGYKIVGIKNTANETPLSIRITDAIYPPHIKYKKGVVDNKNQIVIPLIYEELENNLYNQINLFVAKSNDKYGVIDLKNTTIMPFEYDYIKMGNGYFIVAKQKEPYQWESAVYDFFGKELIPYSKGFYQIIEGSMLLKEESGTVRYVVDKKGNKVNLN